MTEWPGEREGPKNSESRTVRRSLLVPGLRHMRARWRNRRNRVCLVLDLTGTVLLGL
jgi:hypothetical protein